MLSTELFEDYEGMSALRLVPPWHRNTHSPYADGWSVDHTLAAGHVYAHVYFLRRLSGDPAQTGSALLRAKFLLGSCRQAARHLTVDGKLFIEMLLDALPAVSRIDERVASLLTTHGWRPTASRGRRAAAPSGSNSEFPAWHFHE